MEYGIHSPTVHCGGHGLPGLLQCTERETDKHLPDWQQSKETFLVVTGFHSLKKKKLKPDFQKTELSRR